MAENRFLKIEEVLARYQLARATLYALIRRGEFPGGIKVGALRRWPLAALDAWDEAQMRTAGE